MEDGDVSNFTEGSSLYVQFAKESHAGTYRCQFENFAESISRSFNVLVLDADVNTAIIAVIVVVIALIILLIVLSLRIYKDKVCLMQLCLRDFIKI